MSESILTRPAPPADARIAYGDAPQHVADLRRPPGDGPHPAAITIHGGYWRNRYSLDYLGHLCAALTGLGLVTWNLEYRRVGDPGGGWPGTFHDVVNGSRYLLDHADELGVDRSRVVVLGHSAGGHLASWLASLVNVPPGSEIAAGSLPLLAAVPIAGVLDLHRAWELHLSDDAVVELLGGTAAEVPERYAAGSPMALTPPPVPALVIHGDWDDDVPIELSERYHTALQAMGAISAMPPLPRMDHFDVVDPTSRAWPTMARAIQALLDLSGAATNPRSPHRGNAQEPTRRRHDSAHAVGSSDPRHRR